jgi:hypothetical protein
MSTNMKKGLPCQDQSRPVINLDTLAKSRFAPFYPPSQKAPSGRAGMNAKRVSAIALAPVLRSPSSVADYCGGWTGYCGGWEGGSASASSAEDLKMPRGLPRGASLGGEGRPLPRHLK